MINQDIFGGLCRFANKVKSSNPETEATSQWGKPSFLNRQVYIRMQADLSLVEMTSSRIFQPKIFELRRPSFAITLAIIVEALLATHPRSANLDLW